MAATIVTSCPTPPKSPEGETSAINSKRPISPRALVVTSQPVPVKEETRAEKQMSKENLKLQISKLHDQKRDMDKKKAMASPPHSHWGSFSPTISFDTNELLAHKDEEIRRLHERLYMLQSQLCDATRQMEMMHQVIVKENMLVKYYQTKNPDSPPGLPLVPQSTPIPHPMPPMPPMPIAPMCQMPPMPPMPPMPMMPWFPPAGFPPGFIPPVHMDMAPNGWPITPPPCFNMCGPNGFSTPVPPPPPPGFPHYAMPPPSPLDQQLPPPMYPMQQCQGSIPSPPMSLNGIRFGQAEVQQVRDQEQSVSSTEEKK